MAASTGSMAGSAGLFENFFIERFQFFGGKPVFDTFTLAQTREMKCLGVILSSFDMTDITGFKIVRWPGDTAFVRLVFRFALLVALMTGNAVHRKMELPADHSFINKITLVIFFRPDRGRSACSPLGLAAYLGRLDQRLHLAVAGMTTDASSPIGLGCQ